MLRFFNCYTAALSPFGLSREKESSLSVLSCLALLLFSFTQTRKNDRERRRRSKERVALSRISWSSHLPLSHAVLRGRNPLSRASKEATKGPRRIPGAAQSFYRLRPAPLPPRSPRPLHTSTFPTTTSTRQYSNNSNNKNNNKLERLERERERELQPRCRQSPNSASAN